ncbi:unnamed protein product [Boreogadus saida]
MRFCICGGCSNSDLLSDHLRFHSFPDRRKDGAGFRAWVHFVQVTKYTFICAAHFRPEDYVSGDMMEFKMGFRSEKRVRLKAGVVPSIHAAPAAASGSATGLSHSEDHGPRAMLLFEGQACYLEHKGVQTASLKAWMQSQACYVWSGV